MKYKMHIVMVLGFFLSGGVISCNTFKDEVTPKTYTEAEKTMDGKWQLTTVSRNGTDITEAMDFTRFHLTLRKDNTYEIENYLPFLVRRNGTWSIDDPMYPFHLSFRENDSAAEVITEIRYPITNGRRQIILSLSPGCAGNTYVYMFEKVAE